MQPFPDAETVGSVREGRCENGPVNETSTRRPLLRTAAIVLPAVAFVVVIALATLGKAGAPRPGDPAPDFRAPLLEGGGKLALSDLAGKPVVLNFWASWCEPCRDEAPMLKEAFERYGDRVAFVGVNIKDARTEALAFDEEFDLAYPDVRDEGGRIYSAYGLTGQPETFFIGADGKVFEHVNGPLFEDLLAQIMAQLVASDG
jgi:cytochrome c biogenesis protein CcmG, thiol:disulfide interchange protein DsbE